VKGLEGEEQNPLTHYTTRGDKDPYLGRSPQLPDKNADPRTVRRQGDTGGLKAFTSRSLNRVM